MKTSGLPPTPRRAVRGLLLCVPLWVMAVQMPMTAIGQTVYATPYTFTTLAGAAGNLGTNDGTGSAARFNLPMSVAVDGAGNVFVADTQNQTIRKVTPAGVVTTLAGMPEVTGTNDGTGSAARFYFPSGMALDSNDNLYVADAFNNTIRRVTPAGVVTTLAGLPEFDQSGDSLGGYADGTNRDERFYIPAGLALDRATNIYVTESGNNDVRKLTPVGTNWAVTTLAGQPLSSGTNDGTNSDARFNVPRGVAVDSNGVLYVSDEENNTIREVIPSGTNWVVTTMAGLAGITGTNAGMGSAARFSGLGGVAVDKNGNLYLADRNNDTIRLLVPSGTNWVVTTLAGAALTHGTNDGTAATAKFYYPFGVAVDTNGNVYVADEANQTIRKGYPPGSVPQPVLQPPNLSGGQFGFGITGLPNLAVDVQSSSDLTNWQIADTNYYVLVNGTNFFPGPIPAQGNEFYRVRVR
jgi:sugar lactone lactonase YvrE